MARRPYVYVVDDDEGMCRALNRLLNSANIDAAVFHLGADALHEMNRREPDCVVLDVELPDFNSLKLFERINRAFPRVPVVIITAWEDEDVRIKAVEQGAVGVFYKPFADISAFSSRGRSRSSCRARRTSARRSLGRQDPPNGLPGLR